MPRLPYPDPESLTDQRVRLMLERIPRLNLLRMESHAEGVIETVVRLSDAVLNRCRAPMNLRLVAFLRVCGAAASPYEFAQLEKVARNHGIGDDKIAAAYAGDTHQVLDERERLCVTLADELAVGPAASQATFDALRAFLAPREIVEIILGIGFYMMQSRIIETLQIELEEPPVVIPPPSASPALQAWRDGQGGL